MGLWENFIDSTFGFIEDTVENTVKATGKAIFDSALRSEAKEKGILYLPDYINFIKHDYSDNVIAADEKWNGKKFLIEGKVTDIDYGKIRISYTMSHSSGEILDVDCEFTKDHSVSTPLLGAKLLKAGADPNSELSKELSKLHRGSTVSIEGAFSSGSRYSGYPYLPPHHKYCSLRNCKILRISLC